MPIFVCLLYILLYGLRDSVSGTGLGPTGPTLSPPPGAITPGPATYDKSGVKYDYGKALGLSILFYDAERAGKLPANNPIAWRGDSVLYDHAKDGHDLTGGWFDAGNYIKFNFPEGFGTWVLNWGFLKFPDGYATAGLTNMMCDMVRWQLEYFVKCWRADQEILYTQVGDAGTDYHRWGSPETLHLPRHAWQVNASCPGSDVAGDMASSLASGYLVYSTICNEQTFAEKLLVAAKGIYDFGTKYKGSYTGCYPDSAKYYKSHGFMDELTTAAIWLYKATGEARYLQDATSFSSMAIPKGFGWNEKGAGANMLLYEVTHEERYLNLTKAFLAASMPGGTVPYTPCGLMFQNYWASNRYAAASAFIALVAADNDIMPEQYKTWALSQMNYILGDNNYNMSYEIGFGNKYPTTYRHRASACYAFILDCDINSPGDNPHVLYGGLVGGPDENDVYDDVRTDSVHNTVAVDFNAGFQSALAGLVHFANNQALPPSPPRKC